MWHIPALQCRSGPIFPIVSSFVPLLLAFTVPEGPSNILEMPKLWQTLCWLGRGGGETATA